MSKGNEVRHGRDGLRKLEAAHGGLRDAEGVDRFARDTGSGKVDTGFVVLQFVIGGGGRGFERESGALDALYRKVLLDILCVKVEFADLAVVVGLVAIAHVLGEDVYGKRATQDDSVSVGVAIEPVGLDAFDDGVVHADEALTSAVEGELHRFDARLGGDEEEAGENRFADVEGFCLLAQTVLP